MKTTHSNTNLALLALAALLLSACGGNGGGDDMPATLEDCEPIAGGGSTITTTIDPGCPNCAVSDKDKAADADLETGAMVTVGPNAPEHEGVAIRATAQDGIVFPGGNEPRVYTSGGVGGICTAIRTYLDGELQEDADPFCLPAEGEGWESRTTEKPFDAVEFVVTSDESDDDASVKIMEICAGD